MPELNSLKLRIRATLDEDIQSGDVTTLSTISENQVSSAKLLAKADGIFCGSDVADLVLKSFDETLSFTWHLTDGTRVRRGDIIGTFRGNTRILLQAERTLLNLIQRMSGVATQTSRFADLISHTACRILDTRKTNPLWRDLDKYAVRMGGGTNHRIGLYDMVLIKDNHIAAAGSITRAVERVMDYFKQSGTRLDVEVEVKNREELAEVLMLSGITRILLDNMTPEQLRESVTFTNGRVPLEASGNVSLETVKIIAETGVDFISVGSLTHSVQAMDISLLID